MRCKLRFGKKFVKPSSYLIVDRENKDMNHMLSI